MPVWRETTIAFIELGASIVIGRNGLVSAEHAELASLTLVGLLFREKMKVGAAVQEAMLQIGQDPDFHSSLTLYPVGHPPDESQSMPLLALRILRCCARTRLMSANRYVRATR